MVATIESISKDIDFIKAEQTKFSRKALPLIDKQRDLIERLSGSAPGAELKSISKELEKRGKSMSTMGASIATMQKRLDDIKIGLAEDVGAPRGAAKWKSIEEVWKATPSVELFLEEARKGIDSLRNSGKIKVGSWFREGIDYTPGRAHRKGTDLSTVTSPIVTPRYEEQIIERPRQVSLLRQLIGATPVPGTDQVVMYREATDTSPGAELTANIGAAATSAVLTNTTGLTIVSPFNVVTFTEGALTESVTVLTLTTATNTITFAATTNAYTTAAKVTYTAIQETPEGIIKPLMCGDLEAYYVNIVTLALTRKITDKALRNITGLQQYLESAGPSLHAAMESINFWYGNGTAGISGSGIVGLQKDATLIANELADWSTFPTGTTLFGYIIEGMYTLAARGVTSRQVVMTTALHKALAQSTGSDGHYIWNAENPVGVPRSAFVGDMYWDNYLSATDMMMGDFQLGARILDAQTARTDFGHSGDDFSENKITARFEEDVGLGVPQDQYLLKMNADAAPA